MMQNDKPSVLQVSKFYPPEIGGIERVTEQIAEGLNERINIETLVCQKKGKSANDIVNGVKVHRSASIGIWASMPVSFSFLFDFKRLSKDKDIICIHMPFPLSVLAFYLSGFAGKVVLWWHSDIVRQKRLLALYKPLLKWMLKRADSIVVATQGHIDWSDHLLPYKDKCHIITYGIDKPAIKSSGVLESKTEKSENEILFVGRLVYYKGCDVLLDAFSMLKSRDAHLTIIGNGPLLNRLKEKALALKINSSVTFITNCNKMELANYFMNCDMLVLPSVLRSEAFGLVQIEAMSYGKPVINTSLKSGVPYVSINGETGLTVPPGDAQALAKAIDRLLTDVKLRWALGEKGGSVVKERFRLDKMIEQLLTLFNTLMDDK